jgi:hypothetical protein
LSLSGSPPTCVPHRSAVNHIRRPRWGKLSRIPLTRGACNYPYPQAAASPLSLPSGYSLAMATVTISSLSSYSSYRDSRSPLPIEVQHANLAVSSTVYVGNLSCVSLLPVDVPFPAHTVRPLAAVSTRLRSRSTSCSAGWERSSVSSWGWTGIRRLPAGSASSSESARSTVSPTSEGTSPSTLAGIRRYWSR